MRHASVLKFRHMYINVILCVCILCVQRSRMFDTHVCATSMRTAGQYVKESDVKHRRSVFRSRTLKSDDWTEMDYSARVVRAESKICYSDISAKFRQCAVTRGRSPSRAGDPVSLK